MKRVSTAQERMELYRKLADIPEPNRPTNYPLLGQGDMGEWDRYNQTLDAGLNPMQSPDEQQQQAGGVVYVVLDENPEGVGYGEPAGIFATKEEAIQFASGEAGANVECIMEAQIGTSSSDWQEVWNAYDERQMVRGVPTGATDNPDAQKIRDHIGPSLRGQGLNNPGA